MEEEVPEKERRLDALFHQLMQECRHAAPAARLSARLRHALERLPPDVRRGLVARTAGGCAPLFVCARRGNAELAEYLVAVCDAPLEQHGVYEARDERARHSVTPLWCAAVAGRLAVLRVLADAGADLDAPSDSGSTPLRSACFMSHEAVVRELLRRGADPHRPNYEGGTCLINAVQSPRLCRLLLAHGAVVDARDLHLKTALHYAAQEHRADTARLLLRHGADPGLRTRAGDDVLRMAALKGAAPVVALLAAGGRFPPARLADALELLGATHLDELDDAAGALADWRRATRLRHAQPAGYLRKEPPQPLRPALGGIREWRTLDELDALAMDPDALRTQALLVAARVLGPAHRDTVFRLMYHGAAYADALRPQRCVDLWSWALEIRIERDSLLHADTWHTACALTRLMLDAHYGRVEGGVPRHEDAARVLALVTRGLGAARRLLDARPACRRQEDTLDRALRCVSHLLLLALRTARTNRQRERLRAKVRRLLEDDVRSARTGDTLLHLAVSRLNAVRSTYFAEDAGGVFPSAQLVRLLCECGASPLVRNEARSTPLHVAAIPYNHSAEVVAALLAAGAHLDQVNRFGDSAEGLAARGGLCPLRHVSLGCLAARALVRAGLAGRAAALLPPTLRDFLDLHRP